MHILSHILPVFSHIIDTFVEFIKDGQHLCLDIEKKFIDSDYIQILKVMSVRCKMFLVFQVLVNTD